MPAQLADLPMAAFYAVTTLLLITATFGAMDSAVDPHNPAPLRVKVMWPVVCAVLAVIAGRLFIGAVGLLS